MDDQQRFDLYRLHVDEYRFQVTLNWSRSQYYLGLNLAVLGVGAGLMQLGEDPSGSVLVALVFMVGVGTTVFAMIAHSTQHGYYRTARDKMICAGRGLDLGDSAILTTPGMGAKSSRPISVTDATYALFFVIGAANVWGASYVLRNNLLALIAVALVLLLLVAGVLGALRRSRRP